MKLDKLPKVSSEEIRCTLQYLRARATHSCVLCDGDARAFSTPAYRTEYLISALCEECQIAMGIADYTLKTKAA
jgi:hypothetical protein